MNALELSNQLDRLTFEHNYPSPSASRSMNTLGLKKQTDCAAKRKKNQIRQLVEAPSELWHMDSDLINIDLGELGVGFSSLEKRRPRLESNIE